jgi:signal transduction histidine kinase/DNA-binding NarL/FixJ family response regulator
MMHVEGQGVEYRYLTLARLASSLASCSDWHQLAGAIAYALGSRGRPATVRLWGISTDGPVELSRFPAGTLPPASLRELQRAASASGPLPSEDRTLVPLRYDGIDLGVLELRDAFRDTECLSQSAPMVAARLSTLAGRGGDGTLLATHAAEGGHNASAVLSAFVSEAKLLLDHERLSVYLISANGRAFERFAVVSSNVNHGEGILIPYEDLGLRYTFETNRPLVSADLATDERIDGKEDRIIARAGFRGLLSVPLQLGGRPFGLLNFVSRQPGFYTEKDVPVAQQIAAQIGPFIDNLRVQRRALSMARDEAMQRERSRLGRELYQTVSEAVAAISEAAAEGGTPENLARIREVAGQELVAVRRILADVSASSFLADSVEASLERLRREEGLEARLTLDGDIASLPTALQRDVYRIAQEALANVGLHAGATAVEVGIELGSDLVLTVTDDGVGFDPDRVGSHGTGFEGMIERAESLGGFLAVTSRPGEGATVRFTLPQAVAPLTPDALERRIDVDGHAGGASLRVLIADPRALVRGGIVKALEADEGVRIVGQAGSLDELREAQRQLHATIVVLGPGMASGPVDGILGQLANARVLTIADLDRDRQQELLAAGVSGVVGAGVEATELRQALHAVASGARLIGDVDGIRSGEDGIASLSARERSILALVAAGATNAEIGSTLFLATKTVERQVATITRKLGAKNRAHAAAIAVSRKIVDPARASNQALFAK